MKVSLSESLTFLTPFRERTSFLGIHTMIGFMRHCPIMFGKKSTLADGCEILSCLNQPG